MNSHKTSEELTGLTSSEHKLNSFNNELINYYCSNYDKNKAEYNRKYDEPLDITTTLFTKISRYEVHILLTKAFDCDVDPRVSSKFIRLALAKNLLQQNETSLLSSKKKIISPSSNTMYWVNINEIRKLEYFFINKIDNSKGNNVSHTYDKNNLMNYIHSDTNSSTYPHIPSANDSEHIN